jgi:hypothetical protein
MKLLLKLRIATAALVAVSAQAAGCAGTNTNVTARNDNAAAAEVGEVKPVETAGSASAYRAEFKSEPAEIKAGENVALVFTVRDAEGKTVRDLAVVHEKQMHLLVISKDLNEFYHLHPEPQADATYRVAHNFPNGGDYKLYVDYTPKEGKQTVDQIPFKVDGNPRAPIALKEDSSDTKTVDGLRVTMRPDRELRAGQELMLDFTVSDERTRKPVTDLQPYLGALAHFVIVSEDGADFLHAHPMEKTEMAAAEHGGGHEAMPHAHGDKGKSHEAHAPKASASEVSAHTTFPRAGLYKVWAQFQRGGRVSTVPFVVRVGGGEAASVGGGKAASVGNVSSGANQTTPADAVRVTVSGAGYEPSRIEVERGRPVKLAFYRKDAQNCGGEVVFPSLNLRKKLPVGKTTVVEVTPKDTGELAFTCGMGMLKGAVVVR